MSQPERYEPRARSIGGPWKMVKCKDGPYVCHEQHAEIVAALAADKEAETKAVFDAIRLITQLRDENERLRKAAQAVELAFETLDNGLIETPHWVKQQAMRDAVSQLRAAAKEGRDAK